MVWCHERSSTRWPALTNIIFYLSKRAGVNAGDACISLLLYADDIVLIAPTAEKLQSMLNIVAKWCGKWSMQINDKKTRVLHTRNHQRPKSSFQFKCGKSLLDYTSSYKY